MDRIGFEKLYAFVYVSISLQDCHIKIIINYCPFLEIIYKVLFCNVFSRRNERLYVYISLL